MHIPISDSDEGWFRTFHDKSKAYFTPLNHVGNNRTFYTNYRFGTYAEFKEIYPYRGYTPKNRSKVKDKYYT